MLPPAIPKEIQMIVNMDDLPEELKQQLQLQRMESTAIQHQVRSLFRELDKDNLVALGNLLGMIAGAEDSSDSASYYYGMTTSAVDVRFDVCATHGFNHEDDEMKKLTGETVESSGPEPSTPPRDSESHMAWMNGKNMTELMQEYRLKINEKDSKLYCRDCGMEYQSVKDRMVKSPDDCPGCFIKAAHG